MKDLLLAASALCGGFLCAWLSDRYISTLERGVSLFSRISCAACGRSREFWDRIPVLSWLLNGGKCRFCGADLSKREPVISFCIIDVWLLGLFLWLPDGEAFALCRSVSASTLFCAAGLSWINASEHPVLLPLMLCTGVYGVLLPDGIEIGSHLLGAGGMLFITLLMRFLPEKMRGRDKVRIDTILYLISAGFQLGWQSCFAMIPFAFITEAGLLLLARRKIKNPSQGKSNEPSFGDPVQGHGSISLCLLSAAVLTLLFGKPLMSGYLSIFSRIG